LFDPQMAPSRLQAVSWAIQSGLTYPRMPKTYQQVIDELIPDFKSRLSGNFVQEAEDTYQNFARTDRSLPPLNTLLGKMGKSGELMLAAQRQQTILLQQNTSDQLKEQTLFSGQDNAVFRPVKAQDGPWTVMAPGRAYVRMKVVQGNMGTNTLELRILPQSSSATRRPGRARLLNVSQVAAAPENQATELTLLSLLGARFTPQSAAALARLAPLLEGAAGTAAEGVAALALTPELLAALAAVAATLVAAGIIAYSTSPAQALIIRPMIPLAALLAALGILAMAVSPMGPPGGNGTNGNRGRGQDSDAVGKAREERVAQLTGGARNTAGETFGEGSARFKPDVVTKDALIEVKGGNFSDTQGFTDQMNRLSQAAPSVGRTAEVWFDGEPTAQLRAIATRFGVKVVVFSLH
jgi:hypothetical protein